MVFDRTDRPIYVGTAALVFIIPYFGLGQALTAFAERFQRRNVMVSCDALRGVAFLILGVLDPPLLVFFIVLFIAATADPVFEANVSATILETVDGDEYDSAIRLRHVSGEVATLGGLGLGGLLVGWLDAQQVLLADALTFAFSAFVIAGLVARRQTPAVPPTVRETFAGGIRFLRHDQTSRNAVLATMITLIAAMAVQAQVPVIGLELADLRPELIGALAMATPAGSIVALTFVSTRGTGRAAYYRNLVVSLGAAVLTAGLLQFGDNPFALFAAFFTLGFVYQTSMTANILVGRRIPAEGRTVVFGMLQALIIIANGTGAWLGGLAIELLGTRAGAQISLLFSLAALLAVIPKVTPRVAAAGGATTAQRGEELSIDLTDDSRMDHTSGMNRTPMSDDIDSNI